MAWPDASLIWTRKPVDIQTAFSLV